MVFVVYIQMYQNNICRKVAFVVERIEDIGV